MCADAADSLAADIRLTVQACVDTMSEDVGIAEPARIALLSVLADAEVRLSGQDRIPRAVVRALVEIYPTLVEAADTSGASSVRSFAEQIARIDAATVGVVRPGVSEPDHDDLSELFDRLRDAAADVYVPVRMLDGIDDRSVRIFQDTLVAAGDVIGRSELVPRPIAEVLVSTFSTVDFQRRSEYYSPSESQAISIAARAILGSVREWFH